MAQVMIIIIIDLFFFLFMCFMISINFQIHSLTYLMKNFLSDKFLAYYFSLSLLFSSLSFIPFPHKFPHAIFSSPIPVSSQFCLCSNNHFNYIIKITTMYWTYDVILLWFRLHLTFKRKKQPRFVSWLFVTGVYEWTYRVSRVDWFWLQ